MDAKPKMAARQEYRALRSDVHSALGVLREHIDRLGDLGHEITGDAHCDMLGCFASNVIHGADSLLRELDQLVMKPRAATRETLRRMP